MLQWLQPVQHVIAYGNGSMHPVQNWCTQGCSSMRALHWPVEQCGPPTTAAIAANLSRRCLVAFLCFPFLLVISLVGIILWILLLPFKLPCCCCLGCCAQCIANIVEWLVKAPFNIIMWVTDTGTKVTSAA